MLSSVTWIFRFYLQSDFRIKKKIKIMIFTTKDCEAKLI